MKYRGQPLSVATISRYVGEEPWLWHDNKPEWRCACWGEPHGIGPDGPRYKWRRCPTHKDVEIGLA